MNRKDLIFIVSPRTGYIPQLTMSGPIVSPLKIEAGAAYGMVEAGVELHRYDPDTKMTVRLNLNNCYDDHMFDVKEEPVKILTPELDEIPEDLPTLDDGTPVISEPMGMVPETVIQETESNENRSYNNNGKNSGKRNR